MKRRRDSKVESVKLVVSPERDLKLKCKRADKAVYTIFFVVWQRITSGWLLHGFTRSQNRLNNGNNKTNWSNSKIL